MKLYLIRQAKILFIRFRLHGFFGLFTPFFQHLNYLTRLSAWIRKNKKVAYNDFPSKWSYDKRYPMYAWVLEKEDLVSQPIQYLEFGVAGGESFRWFMAQNKHPDSRFHGFDTFTGLPEDFGSYKKGTFNTSNQLPIISDDRGRFYQGLFQQTLPGFLKQFTGKQRKLIMIDADLYTATLYVLTSLHPFLEKGDLIFFDEFAVPTHEFKAFLEFTSSYYVDLELLAAANNYYFTAFKVL